MIYGLVSFTFILTVIAFAVIISRKDKAHSEDLALSLNMLAEQMRQEREQRDELMERIQRPEYRPFTPTVVNNDQPNGFADDLHLVGHVVDNYKLPDDAA